MANLSTAEQFSQRVRDLFADPSRGVALESIEQLAQLVIPKAPYFGLCSVAQLENIPEENQIQLLERNVDLLAQRQRPYWITTLERKNACLTQSPRPDLTREIYDTLWDRVNLIFHECRNNSQLNQFVTQSEEAITQVFKHMLADLPNSTLCRATVQTLRDIFALEQEANSRSTAQFGGSMAGTFCHVGYVTTRLVESLSCRLQR